MRILESMSLQNFKMKKASLTEMKDLNVIIGPNNSGKTSLLRAIELLSKLGREGSSIDCKICLQDAIRNKFLGFRAELNANDKYLRRRKVKISYRLDNKFVAEALEMEPEKFEKRMAEEFLSGQLDRLKSRGENTQHQIDQITLTSNGNEILRSDHLYFLAKEGWIEKIFENISGKTLLCPEERLQTYKTARIDEFLKKRDLGTTVITELLSILKDIVDQRIHDVRTGTMSIVQDFDGAEYIASIAEQGSGVKSLICLCCDILTARDTSILLVDEPELGLNPAGKKAFLEFLLNQAIDKQVFITTHDPTFLNPILWKSQPKIEVGVYLYSQSKNGFMTVDVSFNEDEPSCFVGFLPHTTSMKEYQIYVEGKFDVPVYQVFLEKFLDSLKLDAYDRYALRNKVGIFHFYGGDRWEHFIDTVPSRPFKSLIILDGDKKPIITSKLENESRALRSFLLDDRFFAEIVSLAASNNLGKVPIYCLKEKKIENYLYSKTEMKKGIEKRENVHRALKMTLPEEIDQLFSMFLQDELKK